MLSSRIAILAGLGLLIGPAGTGQALAKPTPLGSGGQGQQVAQAGSTVAPFWMEAEPAAPPAAETGRSARPAIDPVAPGTADPVDTAPAAGGGTEAGRVRETPVPVRRPPVRSVDRAVPEGPAAAPPPAARPAPKAPAADAPPPKAPPPEPATAGRTEPSAPAGTPSDNPLDDPDLRLPEPTAEPPTQPQPVPDRPILRADRVVFDEDLGIMTATGRVELSRARETVYADTVTYNLRTDIIIATGNVRFFQANGDIMFADYAEITGDLRDAFLDQASVLFFTGDRMVGNEAEQTEGRYLRVSRGVFSPCNLCKDDPEAAPIWQVRAEKVVRDKEDLEVRYKNMTMDFFGVPVFWLPYFSHADPTVDRKSGFLAPDWGSSADFGYFLSNQYYFDIAPNRDATLGLTVYEQAFPLVTLEGRNRFERGYMVLSGGLTHESVENLNASGTGTQTDQFRYSLIGDAEYHLNDNWRLGGEIEAASDFNFFRQYLVEPSGNFLESRGYLEGFFGRDYAALEVLRFQSVLPEASRVEPEPVVFPLAQYQMVGDAGEALGGRWTVDWGLRGVGRSEGGTDSNRFTVTPGWGRRLVYGPGLVTDVETEVRSDVYAYAERDEDGSNRRTKADARVVPRAQITTSYPFVRHGERYGQQFEPIVAVGAAPLQDTDPDFPNEDSLDAELRATNLFSPSRFLGDDVQEGGVNAVYGGRYTLFDHGDPDSSVFSFPGSSAEIFLGQSYRLYGESAFPDGSGLESDQSDLVGYLDLRPSRWIQVFYDFRHDYETLERERQTIQTTVGALPLNVTASYDFLVQSEDIESDADNAREEQEYVTFTVGSQLSRYWGISVSHSHTLAPTARALTTTGNFLYRDECVDFIATISRDNSDVPGISNEISATFRIVLRHIGEIALTNLSPGGLFPSDEEQ